MMVDGLTTSVAGNWASVVPDRPCPMPGSRVADLVATETRDPCIGCSCQKTFQWNDLGGGEIQ